jgi:hypothetical protein
MDNSSRRAGVVRLREAIEDYPAEQKDQLDQHALELFARLTADSEEAEDAARAFRQLKIRDRPKEIIQEAISGPAQAALILTACVEATRIARTFSTRIRALEKTPKRLERAENAVAELCLFVEEEIKQLPPGSELLTNRPRFTTVVVRGDDLVGGVMDEPESGLREGQSVVADIQYGLGLITAAIDRRRHMAKMDLLRLAATHGKYHEKAPISAAIYHLAMVVEQVLGKPHLKEVADLASAVLQVPVSPSLVRAAVRVRKKRWGRIYRAAELPPKYTRPQVASPKGATKSRGGRQTKTPVE